MYTRQHDEEQVECSYKTVKKGRKSRTFIMHNFNDSCSRTTVWCLLSVKNWMKRAWKGGDSIGGGGGERNESR